MTIEAEICTRFGDAEAVGGDSCLGASMRMLTEVAVVFSPLVVFAGGGWGCYTRSVVRFWGRDDSRDSCPSDCVDDRDGLILRRYHANRKRVQEG